MLEPREDIQNRGKKQTTGKKQIDFRDKPAINKFFKTHWKDPTAE